MVRALNLLLLQVVTTGQSQANPNSLHRLAIYRLSIELVPSSCCRRFHSFTMVTVREPKWSSLNWKLLIQMI